MARWAHVARPHPLTLSLGAGLMLAGVLLASATPAGAACHAFAVNVDPDNPPEGTSVTVTVSRDAAVNPSSVRVRTVDGTASGGQDYEPVDRRVEFTSGTQQTFTLQILQDQADEPAETFRLELSEGQGCEVNQNFRYGSATVTIVDDDDPAPPAATTTAPPAATTTAPPPPGATTTSSAATTTSTTDTDDASTTSTSSSVTTGAPPTLDDDAALAADEDDGDGLGVVGVVVALLLVAAIGAGTYLLYRRWRAT